MRKVADGSATYVAAGGAAVQSGLSTLIEHAASRGEPAERSSPLSFGALPIGLQITSDKTEMLKLMHRVLLLLAGLLIGGCTHVHVVDSSDKTGAQALNERGREDPARVTLRDGTRFRAEDLHAAADSVFWRNPQTAERGHASFRDIETIEFVSRGHGALEGAGLGVSIGAAAGAAFGLVALAATDDPGASLVPPAAFVLVPAMLGSGAGIIIGIGTGLAKGSIDVYRPVEIQEADSP